MLTEVVAVYMILSAIYVGETGLQFIHERRGGCGSWGVSKKESESRSLSLQNGLKNLLQVIFGILGDINRSGRNKKDKKFHS